jgi:hypothetical protein
VGLLVKRRVHFTLGHCRGKKRIAKNAGIETVRNGL